MTAYIWRRWNDVYITICCIVDDIYIRPPKQTSSFFSFFSNPNRVISYKVSRRNRILIVLDFFTEHDFTKGQKVAFMGFFRHILLACCCWGRGSSFFLFLFSPLGSCFVCFSSHFADRFPLDYSCISRYADSFLSSLSEWRCKVFLLLFFFFFFLRTRSARLILGFCSQTISAVCNNNMIVSGVVVVFFLFFFSPSCSNLEYLRFLY